MLFSSEEQAFEINHGIPVYDPSPAAPTRLAITNAGQINQSPKLRWNACSGATSYKVYRRANFDPYWDFLGSTGSTSYADGSPLQRR